MDSGVLPLHFVNYLFLLFRGRQPIATCHLPPARLVGLPLELPAVTLHHGSWSSRGPPTHSVF